MESRRLLLGLLILCILSSTGRNGIASAKVLYMRATAILSGVNMLGGTEGANPLGFGRATISVYIRGLQFEIRTYVKVNNIYSNGNLPLYGVYIGNRFTTPDGGGVRVPPFLMNWKNNTLNGPVNKQIKSYTYHALRTNVVLTRFLYRRTPTYRLMNNPGGHFAVISYYGAKCALRGQFIKTYGFLN